MSRGPPPRSRRLFLGCSTRPICTLGTCDYLCTHPSASVSIRQGHVRLSLHTSVSIRQHTSGARATISAHIHKPTLSVSPLGNVHVCMADARSASDYASCSLASCSLAECTSQPLTTYPHVTVTNMQPRQVCVHVQDRCVYMLKTDVCVHVQTYVNGYSQDTHRCTNVAQMSKLIDVLWGKQDMSSRHVQVVLSCLEEMSCFHVCQLLLHNTYPHIYVYIHACKRVNNVFSAVCVPIFLRVCVRAGTRGAGCW